MAHPSGGRLVRRLGQWPGWFRRRRSWHYRSRFHGSSDGYGTNRAAETTIRAGKCRSLSRTSLCTRCRSNRDGTGRAASQTAEGGSYHSNSFRKPACIHSHISVCIPWRKRSCRMIRNNHHAETIRAADPRTRGYIRHRNPRRNTKPWRPADPPWPQGPPADRRLRARPSLPTRMQHSQETPLFVDLTSARGRGRGGRWLPPLESSRPAPSVFDALSPLPADRDPHPGAPDLLKPVPFFRQPQRASFSWFAKRP